MAENRFFWRALAPIKRALLAPLSLLLVAATLIVLTPPETTDSVSASSYAFTSHTFTTCGATGPNGPALVSCQTAYSSKSWAQSTSNLNVSSGIQYWTVPVSGLYEITAAGAMGGGSNASSGRIVRGRLVINQGTVLKILVGQSGVVGSADAATGGGGGGSFVTTNSNSPLVIAGGGGGSANGGTSSSAHGQTTTCGQTGVGSGGAGGCSGSGGTGSTFGGGGGGLSTNGSSKTYPNATDNGGKAFVNGGTGGAGGTAGGYSSGAQGGFGGGAGSCACSTGGGGGAGGYSGGGGGGGGYANGGGGGSYIDASLSSVNTNVGLNAAAGYVTIEVVAPVVTTLQPSVSTPSNATSVNYTIQFSENVTGFDVSDISLSGTSTTWTISSFSGSGNSYQVGLTSSSTTTGTLILSIASNSVTGASSSLVGPPSQISSTIDIDVNPPGASVSSAPSSPAAAMSLTFGMTFTESVSGIAASDFSNAGTAAGCVFTPSTSSGSSINIVVTQCQEGTLQLQLASGGVVDAAGNTGPTTAVSSSVVTLAASALSITAASQTVNFGGSWTDSYSQSGLLGPDSITVTYSYSGTTNSGVSYGPSGTKPTQAGSYSIIPTITYGGGNTNRYALTATNGSLTISRIAQSSLTVSTTSMTYGQTLSLATSGGSGTGSVSWQIVTGTCTVLGSTLTPGNAGSSCVVKATKAQDNNYTSASTADTTITIGRASQSTLSVSTTSTSYGNDLVLGTSGGSGTGNVSWQVISGTCSIVGALLTPGNAGSSCVVKATKAQDNNYTAISSSDTTITISKANQNGFSITSASAFTTGSTHTLTASGGQSGGSITWQVTTGICTLSGTSLTASRGAVSCTVEATRAGSSNYFAATDTMVITVDKIVQVLTFQSTPPSSPLVGGTYTVSVTSDASLAPTISIANSSSQVCTISAGVISFISAGTCTVNAVQAGNDQIAAASASQQISVSTVPTTTTTIASAPGSQDPAVSTTTIVARGGATANTAPSTTSTTTSTTTTTTIPELGTGGVTEVEAGEATAMVQGKRVKVSVETVAGEIIVKLPNDVQVKVGAPKGVVTGAVVNSDGVLVAYSNDQFQVGADGFAAGSTYVVTMYSDPMELNRGEVGSTGSVASVVKVPKDVEAGEHTLVIEGVGPDAEVVAVSIGFKVVERSDNTMAAVLAVSIAILLALLGGRPIWRRRKNRALGL